MTDSLSLLLKKHNHTMQVLQDNRFSADLMLNKYGMAIPS